MENENVLDANENVSGERPTFLTVLCVLTFIGSGLGVLGGILGLVGSSALASLAPAAGAGIIWALLGLASSALCLTGAIQMWGLKKMGFTLYLAGSGLAILVAIINGATASSSVGQLKGMGASEVAGAANTMIWTTIIFSILITVAFVLMYNANKKHLVN